MRALAMPRYPLTSRIPAGGMTGGLKTARRGNAIVRDLP